MAQRRRCFQFAPDAAGEYLIDADPRTIFPSACTIWACSVSTVPMRLRALFRRELAQLQALVRVGWLSIDGEWLSLTPTRAC
jgi:hypothetical protein